MDTDIVVCMEGAIIKYLIKLLIPYARLLLHTMYNATHNLKNPNLEEIPISRHFTFPSLQFLPLFIDYLLPIKLIFLTFTSDKCLSKSLSQTYKNEFFPSMNYPF
jgi:hypothetical protein